MKAIGFNKYGGPEVLQEMEAEDPVAGRGEVVVRVRCTSVTSLDVLVRSGRGDPRISLPHIPGVDAIGKIESIGSGASNLSIGERAFVNTVFGCGTCDSCKAGNEASCSNWKTVGMQVNGAYGELLKVPASTIIRPPSMYSAEELACMPIGLSAAWSSLKVLGKAREGEHVLIWGASGNVGLLAMAIAKASGLRVIGVTRGEKKKAQLMRAGADHVMDYNSGMDTIVKEVKNITRGEGADIVLESFGATLNESVKMAREGGRIMLFGSVAGPQASVNVVGLYRKGIRVIGVHNVNRSDMEEALGFLSKNNIRPIIAKKMSIGEATKAHALFETSECFGKILLSF